MQDRLAVIFDMDGVLVDSYYAHLRSWQEVAAKEGRQISEAEFASQFGRTSREIIADWGVAYSEEKIAALDEQKEAAFRRILAADFPVMPGAMALLRALNEAGFALAVGSSGPPANVELVLQRLGGRHVFDAVVTGGDVSRGKPDPEVFLIASRRLGVAPHRCAVVEDAPQGIQAAKAAGMAAVALVSTGRHREMFTQADLVVDRLDELSPGRIAQLVCRRR